jgi:hypothetical protein
LVTRTLTAYGITQIWWALDPKIAGALSLSERNPRYVASRPKRSAFPGSLGTKTKLFVADAIGFSAMPFSPGLQLRSQFKVLFAAL